MASFKKNIVSVYSANFVNGVLGIVVIPLGIKLMGTSGYGLFSIYALLVSYINLVDLGIGKNLVRLLASERRQTERTAYLQTAFGSYLIISGLLLLLLPLLVFIIPILIFPVPLDRVFALRLIISFAVIEYIIAIPTSMIQNYCFASERFGGYSKFVLLSGFYRYLLMFIAICVFKSPEIVVAFVVARRLIDVFVARWLMGPLPREVWRPRCRFGEFKKVVGRSASLSVAQLLQSTVIGVGSFLVNRYFGLNGLGIYRAAFDLSNRVWFFSNGMGLVVFPKFAGMLSEPPKQKHLFGRLPRMLDASWAGYNLLLIVGVLMAPFVFRSMHLTQTHILELFILTLLGVCLNAHGSLSYEFLQAAGKYRLSAGLAGLSLSVLVLVFFAFYKTLGVLSIGVAWIVSQACYSLISDSMTLAAAALEIKAHLESIVFKLVILGASILMVAEHFVCLLAKIRYLPLIVVLVMLTWAAIRLRFREVAQR